MDGFGNVDGTVVEKLKAKGAAGRIALVGASTNPEKYGNIIIKNLVGKGYEVIPINPKEAEIEGLKSYSSLLDVADPVGIVNFVVPPAISLQVLEKIKDGPFDTVWFQDGSFNKEVVARAHELFEHVVYDACIMVVTNFV